MDTVQIFNLVDAFYGEDFGMSEGTHLFGANGVTEVMRPGELRIAPQDPAVSSVFIETLNPIPPSAEPFLAGVVVRLAVPARLRLEHLQVCFGEARVMPRLKPQQDISFQFRMKTQFQEGYLLFSTDPTDLNSDEKRVHRITLRRFRAREKA